MQKKTSEFKNLAQQIKIIDLFYAIKKSENIWLFKILFRYLSKYINTRNEIFI